MGIFEGKTVLISGGLGDIALATALAFGREGAMVALSDVKDKAVAERLIATFKGLEGYFRYDQVDVADASAVAKWIDSVREQTGHVDIAIVNAATVTLKNILEIGDDEWSKEIDINLKGAFYMARKAMSSMLEQGVKGSILFLGSWAAHAVHQKLPTYSVSKAGVRMLCQCMALEAAPYGIRVNEIAPGYVNAGLSKVVWNLDPGMADAARQKVPTGLLIEPEELASSILWICQEKNLHMTGSCLLMDGGLSLLRP